MPPMTPAAWQQQLDRKLIMQQRRIRLFEDYYDGRHRMAFQTAQFRQHFGAMFRALADNWCPSVVDAAVDRLTIWGFRFGDSTESDQSAWDIWQANNLDARSKIAHTEAGKDGAAYILVAPSTERNRTEPVVTVEHASQMVVEHEAANPMKRAAAYKRWAEVDGYHYAVLYLPDQIIWWRTKEKVRQGSEARNWIVLEDKSGANPFDGVVNAVPLYNKPSLVAGGYSDLETAIPLQDAINKELADMLIASEFAAFPQRVFMGIEVPKDPQTGLPTQAVQLKAAVSRFWAVEKTDAKIGEFKAADLENYVKAITLLLQHLSAQTRTPPHYLLGQVVNISGDALEAAETGLTNRVERKQEDFEDGWEEAMRLAFRVTNQAEKAADLGAETIWKPAAKRSEAAVWDAASKMKDVGVPNQAIWEYAGFTPKQIKRFKEMQEDEPTPPAIPAPPEPAVPTS